MFKPCILVPVYNHGVLLEKYLPSLLAHDYPVLLVNDGSNQETTDIIKALVAHHDQVEAFHLEKNQGKGGAIAQGFLWCESLGFTHALQIDADGQHEAGDIDAFMRLAQQYPQSLISGKPVYDDSVPKHRLYGRYITHFWVWVETLSFSVADSMCGFRVYPVKASAALARQDLIKSRMDFDTDIMVRLYWQQVPVHFIETNVHYPEDGVSHFDVLHDNLRITLMHTLLVMGMLLRLPRLLASKFSNAESVSGELDSNHWASKKERGSLVWMKLTLAIYRVVGKRPVYWLLYLIIGFFFLTGSKARDESMRYLRKLWHFRYESSAKVEIEIEPTWRESFQHFMAFGRACVDRLDVWSGKVQRDELNIHNPDQVDALLSKPQGAVLLTSHLGNVEVMRGLLARYPHLKINVLMFTDNAAQMNNILSLVNRSSALNIIPVNEVTPATAMLLNEKIMQGECVAIAADRVPPVSDAASVPATFLGERARFPAGPFVLAALLACPVYTLFCVKQSGQYQLHLELFAEQLDLPRRKRGEKLPQVVQDYASVLERLAIKYPYQWFNFFNFWQ